MLQCRWQSYWLATKGQLISDWAPDFGWQLPSRHSQLSITSLVQLSIRYATWYYRHAGFLSCGLYSILKRGC